MGKIFIDKKGYPHWKDTKELVHRKVAQKSIGRELKENEVVHHIDGNVRNFKRENLKVMTRREHARIHLGKQGTIKAVIPKKSSKGGIVVPVKDLYCIDCGRPISHVGRCLACNMDAKRKREAQEKKKKNR